MFNGKLVNAGVALAMAICVFAPGARAALVESAALALPGAVREIALSGDGSVGAIAIAGDGDSVSELLVFSALDLTVLKRFPASVYCVDVSHDGNLVAYGVINSGVYVYNVALDSSTLVREAIPPAQVGQGSFTWAVHAVAFSPDGTQLATVLGESGGNQYGHGFSTELVRYDLASLTELGAAMTLSSASGNSTTTFGGGTRDVVFTADGTRLVTGDGTTTTPFSFPTPGTCSSTGAGLRVIDIATGTHQRVGLGFLPKYLSLGDGQVCAYSVTCTPNRASVYDLASVSKLSEPLSSAALKYSAFTADGAYLLARNTGTIEIYEGATLLRSHDVSGGVSIDGSVIEVGSPRRLLTASLVGEDSKLLLLEDTTWIETGAGEGSAEGGWEGEVPAHIAADQDQNGAINVFELSRLIQFYNSGGYSCASGTEDGFAPGAGAQDCAHHQTDYNPQNWVISLSELLRLVQFYNAGGYHACAASGTEDGYCPGP